jgi:hypothetical protein
MPGKFVQRLIDRKPVCGLEVDLPFTDELEADLKFWSGIAEKPKLRAPESEKTAKLLRRAGVPLRCRQGLSIDIDDPVAVDPRVEAHLHPFGVAALTTVDMIWDQPALLEDAADEVDKLEDASATITVGSRHTATIVSQAATSCAELVVDQLSDPKRGDFWDVPSHRVVSAIEVLPAEPFTEMPDAGSPLHRALHRLSAGGHAVADPQTAFVATWTGTGYAFPTSNMLYMLNWGSALLPDGATAEGPPSKGLSAGDRHRQLLLLVAYINATTGLIDAATASDSQLIQEWASTAAMRLGNLFGPGEKFLTWGQVPQALMQRTGAADIVSKRRREIQEGADLSPNPRYPVPKYPTSKNA